MDTLINDLFPESQVKAINQLLKDPTDPTSKTLIQKEIGKELIKNNEIINSSFPQLISITSLSPFASSLTECENVSYIIIWGLKKINILPLITEHENEELAYRCFISLSFFKKALIKRYERYGAPNPNFYRNIGVKSFESLGMNEISNHFNKWEMFLEEMFI